MSALMPLFAGIFLGVMGWALLWMIGNPSGPETFNPNSCSSCSSKQGGQVAAESRVGEERSEHQPGFPRFAVAPGHHRLTPPQ